MYNVPEKTDDKLYKFVDDHPIIALLMVSCVVNGCVQIASLIIRK